jgi:methyl-accepting chemotaxis protein
MQTSMLNGLSIGQRLYTLVAGGAMALFGLTGLCVYTASKMYAAAAIAAGNSNPVMSETRDRLIVLAVGICITSLIVVVPVFTLVVMSVLNRLRTVALSLERVAAGDLTQRSIIDGTDEIAQLQRVIQRMQDGLRGIVGGVRERSVEMSEAVNEIAIGNDDLSRRTELQASLLQRTASNLLDMSRALTATASGTERAKELTSHALDLSEQSGVAVQSLIAHMHSIKQQSNRIAEIVALIDGIAFQTNILALNAAVESARAGELGRGFAVVAGEVRMLAGRCSAAAKEIGRLISCANAEIEQGWKAADSSGASMERLSQAVRGASNLVSEVNATTTAQASELAAIQTELSRVDDVTQQNAARVEQAAAAAENVKSRAHELVTSVEAFRLPDQDA